MKLGQAGRRFVSHAVTFRLPSPRRRRDAFDGL